MAGELNFRDLVNRARRRGRPIFLRMRSPAWAAKSCDISVAYLYCLINGERVASDVVVAKVARGLNFTRPAVRRALARSRDEAEVTT